VLVTWLFLVLLAVAIAIVVGAEWPRIASKAGLEARRRRDRAKRKSQLRVIHSERDKFAESVTRDLDELPTIEETEPRH
jgi:uncharacterized protein YpmS